MFVTEFRIRTFSNPVCNAPRKSLLVVPRLHV